MSTLVIFLFEDETAAFEMRMALLRVQKQYLIELEDSVVVTHDQKGKIRLDQAVDLTRTGVRGGRFWETLVGLVLAQPPLTDETGTGTNVTTDPTLSIKPGSSALFVLVRTAAVDTVLQALKNFAGRARVFQTSLTKDQEERLEQPLDPVQVRQAPRRVGAVAAGVSSLRAPLLLYRRFVRDAFFPLVGTAWREYERDYARYYAIAVVYYALITLVPLLLLILAVLGLILQHSEVAAAAERELLSSIEASLGPEFASHIEHAFQMLGQDSFITTTISLAGLLIAVAALFKHLRLTFRALWKQTPPLAAGTVWQTIQAVFRERLIAFLMVLAVGALLLVAFGLLTLAQWAATLARQIPSLGSHAGWLVGEVPALLIAPVSFALLFRYLPPQRLPWRDVALAAVLCGGAWVLGAELLTRYGRFLGEAPSAYGTLGGLLVVMLWMKVVTQTFFFGAEICKVVWSTDRARVVIPVRLTDAA